MPGARRIRKGNFMGGGKTKPKVQGYMDKGMTEVGKEQNVQSYKEYVKQAFGGGMPSDLVSKKIK
tara:strand:+ start:191 stop:385 length:195 start_codon:yes stop_codon:yes gene_type:complete